MAYYNNCNSCTNSGCGISTVGGIDVSRPPYSCFPPFGSANNCSCTTNRPCGCGGCNSCSGVGGTNTCGCGGCNSNCNSNCNRCGCGRCGCGRACGGFGFFNVAGTTLGTGAVVPLRYVLGNNCFSANTTGGTVNLESGTYIANFTFSATAPFAARTITITPEISGTARPEFSRSFTTAAADQSFSTAGGFAFNIPCDTATSGTVNLTVTVTGDTGGDVTTLTDVDASMTITKVS